MIGVHRHNGACADGPDADVAGIDVPTLLVRIVGAAAGEGGVIDHDDRIGAHRMPSQPLVLAGGTRPGPNRLVNRLPRSRRTDAQRF